MQYAISTGEVQQNIVKHTQRRKWVLFKLWLCCYIKSTDADGGKPLKGEVREKKGKEIEDVKNKEVKIEKGHKRKKTKKRQSRGDKKCKNV